MLRDWPARGASVCVCCVARFFDSPFSIGKEKTVSVPARKRKCRRTSRLPRTRATSR